MLLYVSLLLSIAAAKPQLRGRFDCPDESKRKGTGCGHGEMLAAECIHLRSELAAKPSTTCKVIDHGHTFYVTEAAQKLCAQMNKPRPARVAPVTPAQ
jgi:hypothetical protein